MSNLATKTSAKRTPFGKYTTYVSRLQALMLQPTDEVQWGKQVFAALDGQASVELRRSASLKIRRKYGAYFTGTKLSGRLLSKCKSTNGNQIYYDPSCGMGDLLLAAAKRLPLKDNLTSTLSLWGDRLMGTDLHEEFIKGTIARLVLLARQRHRTPINLVKPAAHFFPHIRVANGLNEKTAFQKATILLMNPPFGLVAALPGCKWAGGRVSEAATFIITALERVRPDTEILAILPEVLRAGAFSQNWRDRVGELAEIHLVKPYGIFDDSADIDVFILRLVRRRDNQRTQLKHWPTSRRSHSMVADYFDVHVGRVVPHRDPETGPEYSYIHPRSLPTWTVLRQLSEKRRHQGQVYHAPFVAIRRTSRPGHPYRAAATVIAGNQPVAVENHLIVCNPKDKTLKSCQELMRQLKTKSTNEFLDKRIRCRHLTVGAVSETPFTLPR